MNLIKSNIEKLSKYLKETDYVFHLSENQQKILMTIKKKYRVYQITLYKNSIRNKNSKKK